MIRRIAVAAGGSTFFSTIYLSGAALVPGPLETLPLVAGLVAPPLVGVLWLLIVTKAHRDDVHVASGEVYRRAILRIGEEANR